MNKNNKINFNEHHAIFFFLQRRKSFKKNLFEDFFFNLCAFHPQKKN